MKKSKVYMTKKRRTKIFMRKAIALISAIAIGSAIIGHAGVRAEKEISRAVASDPIIVRIKAPAAPVGKTDLKNDLSVEGQIRAIAAEHDFKWPDYLVRLAKCESTLNPKAVNVNRNGSRDLGLFQINDVHGLPDKFRFDIREATEWTMEQINAGRQRMWVCNDIVLNR